MQKSRNHTKEAGYSDKESSFGTKLEEGGGSVTRGKVRRGKNAHLMVTRNCHGQNTGTL